MKNTKRFLAVLLTAGMVLAMPCMTAAASQTGTGTSGSEATADVDGDAATGTEAGADAGTTAGAYNYKITVYAGNKGTIGGADSVTVDTDSQGASLTYGSYVTLYDIVKAAEPTDEKYYVMGVRLAGRDNLEEDAANTAATAASGFTVEGDADYVIAYGIKGDMVSYTVQYLDGDGNELLESDTFYGNVGDKPVAAYRYVEGYTPQALAVTKTLSSNEAENIFTFTYTPGEMETVYVDNVITTITTQTATTAGTTAGTTTAGGAAAGGAAAGAGTTAGGTDADADAGTDENMVNVPDEDTPTAVEDLDEIEDEDPPAANQTLDGETAKGLPLAGSVAIAAVAAAVLIGLIVAVAKKKKNS